MLTGMYTATAGMATEMSAMDVISNNLSNSNTVGYREDFESLLREAANPQSYGMGGAVRSTGILQVQTKVDSSQGRVTPTDGPLDLALEGPGMFAVQTPNGIDYTRSGRLHRTPTGQLATEGGNLVLDTKGQPITIPDTQGKATTIKRDGTIYAGDVLAGQIGVSDSAGWTKVGNGLYAPTGPVTTVATPMLQGYIEESNIDLVQLMGSLMTVQRAFQAANQMQHSQDQILQQAVNDIARLA